MSQGHARELLVAVAGSGVINIVSAVAYAWAESWVVDGTSAEIEMRQACGNATLYTI